MNKHFWIIFLCIVSCTEKAKIKPSNSKKDSITIVQINRCDNYSITKATALDFVNAHVKSHDAILKDTLLYRKQNGIIQLPLNNKQLATFTDTLLGTDDTNVREYKYEGQYKNIGYYFVSGLF